MLVQVLTVRVSEASQELYMKVGDVEGAAVPE